MSTWSYCNQCNEAMEYPSLGEKIVGTQVCDSCGTLNPSLIGDDEVKNLINALEAKVICLEEQVKSLLNHT